MDRAHKFLDDIERRLEKHFDKDVHEMHPREIDFIVGLCDLHENVCEFVELAEKRESSWRGDYHDDEHEMEGNPVRRRRRR